MDNIAIKYDKIFEINSKVIKSKPTVGKLPTLLIVKYDDKFPTERWSSFTNLTDVKAAFPPGAVRDFASNYFGFVNKKGEMPDLLHIMTWDTTDKPMALVGGHTPELAELKKVNGKVKFTFGTESHDIDINLTGKNSHTEMATQIQTALKTKSNINGFKDASVVWSTVSHSFIIKPGGDVDNILFTASPNSGTDVSNKLGFSEDEGARIVKKNPKLKDIDEVLDAVFKRNDTYYVVALGYELDNINDLEKIGAWVANSNFEYLFLYTTTKSEVLKQYNYLEKFHGFNGLVVDYYPTMRAAGYSAGAISSMNLSKVGSNINIAFNDGERYNEYAITDATQLDNLQKNRANSFVKFGRNAAPFTWYYDGSIFGDISSTNVYIGHSFLKFNFQQTYANYFATTAFIGLHDKTSHEKIILIGYGLLQKAVASGIIVGSVELTAAEEVELRTSYGEAQGNGAIQSITSTGYYISIDGVDEKTKCINIKISYVANTPAKRLCITNFIYRA